MKKRTVGGGGGGGQKRVDLSFCVFPCFAVVGVPMYPEAVKNSTKMSLSYPLLCAPNANKN